MNDKKSFMDTFKDLYDPYDADPYVESPDSMFLSTQSYTKLITDPECAHLFYSASEQQKHKNPALKGTFKGSQGTIMGLDVYVLDVDADDYILLASLNNPSINV